MAHRLKWERYSVSVMPAVADLEHVGVVPMTGSGKAFETDLQIDDIDYAV